MAQNDGDERTTVPVSRSTKRTLDEALPPGSSWNDRLERGVQELDELRAASDRAGTELADLVGEDESVADLFAEALQNADMSVDVSVEDDLVEAIDEALDEPIGEDRLRELVRIEVRDAIDDLTP